MWMRQALTNVTNAWDDSDRWKLKQSLGAILGWSLFSVKSKAGSFTYWPWVVQKNDLWNITTICLCSVSPRCSPLDDQNNYLVNDLKKLSFLERFEKHSYRAPISVWQRRQGGGWGKKVGCLCCTATTGSGSLIHCWRKWRLGQCYSCFEGIIFPWKT